MHLRNDHFPSLILCVTACVISGCSSGRFAGDHPLAYYRERIQNTVEGKLDKQREPRTGEQRWEDLRTELYQSDEDLKRNRRPIETDQVRLKRAEELRRSGPITLEQCLTLCLELNDRILASREEIQAVGGDELVANSRFLPRVEYLLDHESIESKHDAADSQTDHSFRSSLTLFEFGKDNPVDVTLRQQQRDALFAYEDVVSAVLSDVRTVFFTVLLRQEQVTQRRKLYDEFKARYEQINQRLKEGRAVEVDLLTARLNVLNEELRINELEKDTIRQSLQLLHVIGFPVGLTDINIVGKLETFDLPVERAVELALQRSTSIAQARSIVFEQQRRAQQVFWEDAPSIASRVGWKDNQSAAGVDFDSNDGTYTLAPFAEKYIDQPRDGFSGSGDLLADTERGWFADVFLTVPLFTGFEATGKRMRERALLVRDIHVLRDTVSFVELRIRQAYQVLLERRKEMDIQRETVQISRQRLVIQEKLKELDKVTDNELETFRNRFFEDQDALFRQQILLVRAQEELRQAMRYFEPLPTADGEAQQ